MVNDLERREPLSGLRSVVHPTGEVAGVRTLQEQRIGTGCNVSDGFQSEVPC